MHEDEQNRQSQPARADEPTTIVKDRQTWRVNRPLRESEQTREEWRRGEDGGMGRMELLASLPTFPPAIIALNNSAIAAPNQQNQGIQEVEEVG